MRLKKLFITIGSIGGVVATIPFVVSCNGSNHEGASTTENNNDGNNNLTPKKYSYSFNLNLFPLFQDNNNPKGELSYQVKFKSNNTYDEKGINDSIYIFDEDWNNPVYFKYSKSNAIEIAIRKIGSDILEINKIVSNYKKIFVINMKYHDLYKLSITDLIRNENKLKTSN